MTEIFQIYLIDHWNEAFGFCFQVGKQINLLKAANVSVKTEFEIRVSERPKPI